MPSHVLHTTLDAPEFRDAIAEGLFLSTWGGANVGESWANLSDARRRPWQHHADRLIELAGDALLRATDLHRARIMGRGPRG